MQELEALRFQESRSMGMVSLLAFRPGPLYPPPPQRNFPDTDFCQKLSRNQGHSAAGRIMSLKNSNDTIGNRNRDLP